MQAFRKLLCSVTLLLVSQQIHAQGVCEQWLGKLASSQGQVEIRRAGTSIWRPVMRGERYCDLDAIRTGRNSRAVVILNTDPSNRTLTNLNQNTFLTFKSLVGGEPNALELLIDLLKGGALFRSRQPNRLGIETPYVNAAHRGTEFFVRVDTDQTLVTVYDGQVSASNTEGELTIDKGETALAKSGKAPVKYALVRPRDAVQWALNYPPVIDYHAASSAPSHPAIGDALSAYRRGDLLEGLAILDKVPEAQREPDYYTAKAGLLLSVGRVDEAMPAIEQALTLDSKNATAFALKSVVAVAQNRNDEAMQLAERAAQLDPKSPTPQVALSYAHQAKFELEKALESAEKAANLGSGNALALSRLSELQLSMGDLDEALEAAEKATALDPDLARTQTVLGFAYLTKIDIDEARQTFEKAIELDQAAPLPHLGLGLAKIREGELKNGTDEIEIAASLDPDNSLIRSYLGKAFYEKKENILAGTELEIAKELDPNDPTSWFYDAIRKQTTNRPVEALHDMQKAIELNDNRAVYRSRLLLDDDLAARSAALGRTYNDLGFQQRGLFEGWKSVNTEPGDYSAHRLLADNYATLRRHDIARVSELLQSQLLQPANINPIQPQLAETNLLILDSLGPAAPSFNEFNPLFTRNRLALQASGVVGGNGIIGDEVTQSGLWNNHSYSLGQFHYETDGFQNNRDLKQDIYTGFLQTQLLPNLSVQTEIRYNETDQGDLRLRFTPLDPLVPIRRTKTRRHSARLGFHYEPFDNHNILGSLIYNDLRNRVVENDLNLGIQSFEQVSNIHAYTAELQYLFESKALDLTLGAGHFDQDRNETTNLVIPIFDELLTVTEKVEPDTQHTNGYAYSNLRLSNELTATLGVSVDSFNRLKAHFRQVNPKLGLTLNIFPSTTLRAAAFRTIKRPFASNQTIEPTQIAGFNQFFDDIDASKTQRFGIALDQVFSKSLFGGLEASWRKIREPTIVVADDEASEERQIQREQLHRAYLYWTPLDQIALRAEYFFERIRRDPVNDEPDRPIRITTHRVPLALNYFHANGLFAKFGATFVDQGVRFFPESPFESGNNSFWILDTSVGYRLPKRLGIASIGVKNLLDEHFRFEDINTQTGEPINPLFQPDRVVFAQLLLSF